MWSHIQMPPANYWTVEGFFPFNTYKCIVCFLLGQAKKKKKKESLI